MTKLTIKSALTFLMLAGVATYAILTILGFVLLGVSHQISEAPIEGENWAQAMEGINATIESVASEEFKISCSVVMPIFALWVFSREMHEDEVGL